MNDEVEKGEAAKAAGVTEPAAAKAEVTKLESRDWIGWAIFAGGAGAILWGLFSAIGAGWGLWGWRSGFTGVTWSFFLSLAIVLLSLVYWWWQRRKNYRGNRLLQLAGLAFALVYAGWITSYIFKARSVPAIHDISTDLADPPQFRALELRKDNWDNIPGEDDADMRGLNPQQRWRRLHQEAYGDIRTVRVEQPVAQVLEKAERLAEGRGWDIASIRPSEGRIEATATTSLFRFKDDVVVRVRPTENGNGSIVDMRSVSRVGQSDIGANAERVRSFLADLSGTVTTS